MSQSPDPPPHFPPPGPPPPPPPAMPRRPPPQKPPQPASTTPRHTGLGIVSFVISLLGFILGIIPFVGLLGILGALLGAADLSDKSPTRRRDFGTGGVIIGVLATLGAGIWALIFFGVSRASSHGSCPHVYAFDGERYRLDGDLVSGALYAGAERDDLDRMESLRAVPVGGDPQTPAAGVPRPGAPGASEYRLRVLDELEETDHVDRLSLRYVDHPAGVEVLPTQDGTLLALRDAAGPTRAVDEEGRDVLPLLASLDGRMVSDAASAAPRATWTLDFPRPPGDRLALIVRGHNTAFAEEALVTYLATMGQGLRDLVEWGYPRPCPCARADIDEEIDRLGLPLSIDVSAGDTRAPTRSLQPVGPAILRSQALVVDVPPGGDRVTVRLSATPLFWEIDQVMLASASEPLTPAEILPRSAVRSSGEDVTSILSASDDQHVVLRRGEHVDVLFDAPAPAPGLERTIVASMRGYYAMDVGGHRGLNLAAVLGHRLGVVSLPSLARDLAKRRAR